MKSRIFLLSCLFFYLFAFHSSASAEAKKFNLSIGTNSLTIVFDTPFLDDIEFSGSAFSGSYAFSNNIAIRANFYSMENDISSQVEANGTDLVLLFGSGLEKQGFKAYLGAGFFDEDWEIPGLSENFSGIQLNAGLGYNWDIIILDAIIGVRDTTDYDDLVINTDVAAITISLSIGARF